MGYFSWKTQDTDESIPNVGSGKELITVYMLGPNGECFEEMGYEGYGEFGGKDYYEFLAELNGYKTRDDGIGIEFDKIKVDKPVFPSLVRNKSSGYQNKKPENCEFQGFFYD